MDNHAELVNTAEELLAAVKENKGDQLTRMNLLKQIDKARYLAEGPMDTIIRQFETVSISNFPIWVRPCFGLTADR